MKLVLHCSDHRVEKANLWKLIKDHIIPPHERWQPIGVLGGPIALAHPAELPIDFAYLIRQIEFAKEQFKPDGFVAVGHDCGYYSEVTKITGHEFSLDDKISDMLLIARLLENRFKLPVSLYFRKPGRPGFDQIPNQA